MTPAEEAEWKRMRNPGAANRVIVTHEGATIVRVLDDNGDELVGFQTLSSVDHVMMVLDQLGVHATGSD